MSAGHVKNEPVAMRDFAIEAARLLSDRHCEDVLVLDVRDLSQVCHYVVLATGTSDRQMKSLASELDDLGEELGHRRFRFSRDEASTWIVVDFVELVVHLFEPNQRAYYDLEGLWADASHVPWHRDGDDKPAGRDTSGNGESAGDDSAGTA